MRFHDFEELFLDDPSFTGSSSALITASPSTEPIVDREKTRTSSVLVPRSSPTVRVKHSFERPPHKNDSGRDRHSFLPNSAAPSPFSSPIDSDASASLVEASVQTPRENASHERAPPPIVPPDPAKLLELIEKGKALQKSMARATEDEDEDEWSSPFPAHLRLSGAIDGNRSDSVGDRILRAAALDDSNSNDASGGEDDPESWQSVLKRARSSRKKQHPSSNLPVTPPPAASLRQEHVPGLKVSFDAIGFTKEFVSRLQQLRDSFISSRFSPVEVAVSHSDVLALFLTAAVDRAESEDGALTSEPLFTFTPSLQKHAFRLSFSHVVPLQSRALTTLRSSTKQLTFRVVCQPQGTPRRRTQASRSGRRAQLVLQGHVAAHEVFACQESTAEPQLVKVYLFACDERTTGARVETRTRASTHRVGVLKVRFQVCTVPAPPPSTRIKVSEDDSDSQLESSFRSSTRDNSVVVESSEALSASLDAWRAPRLPDHQRQHGNKPKRPDQAPPVTVQLAVMIDRATSISLRESRIHNNGAAVVVRFQYAVPCNKSAVDSLRRSFKRKLVRVGRTHGDSRRFSANVGHVGVFPFDLAQVTTRALGSRLLVRTHTVSSATQCGSESHC